MNSDERWFPSHLNDMERTECLELLGSHQVGRVAYCDDLGPVVLPVNYVIDHGTVLIQLSPHSTLARNLRSAPASFEVDEFDDYNQSGWSVLVRGAATYVEPDDLRDADDRPVAWAEGERTFHVRITPHDISGRRLLPA
jgi:uncharacterized protein